MLNTLVKTPNQPNNSLRSWQSVFLTNDGNKIYNFNMEPGKNADSALVYKIWVFTKYKTYQRFCVIFSLSNISTPFKTIPRGLQPAKQALFF